MSHRTLLVVKKLSISKPYAARRVEKNLILFSVLAWLFSLLHYEGDSLSLIVTLILDAANVRIIAVAISTFQLY